MRYSMCTPTTEQKTNKKKNTPGRELVKIFTPSGKLSFSPQKANPAAKEGGGFPCAGSPGNSPCRSISRMRKRMDSTSSSFFSDWSIFGSVSRDKEDNEAVQWERERCHVGRIRVHVPHRSCSMAIITSQAGESVYRRFCSCTFLGHIF